MNKWTQFWDMSSGGGRKLTWKMIYIEAPEALACHIFSELFGRDPHNVTCDCCGGDYAIYEFDSLEEAVKYHLRGKETLEQYVQLRDVKVVYAKDCEAFTLHKEMENL